VGDLQTVVGDFLVSPSTVTSISSLLLAAAVQVPVPVQGMVAMEGTRERMGPMAQVDPEDLAAP
jgi:hypothetical protein